VTGRVIAGLLLAAGGALACRPAKGPAPSPTPPAAASPADTRRPLKPEALARYREAQGFVAAGKLDEARASLEAAVAAEPDFTEAWYNLGANLSNMAVREAGRNDDPRAALDLFRRGVAAKILARALMNDGKWFVYGEKERAVVEADLKEALRDMQQVMADEETLFLALRMRARGAHTAEE